MPVGGFDWLYDVSDLRFCLTFGRGSGRRVEEVISREGMRPEVLRRVSAGTQAVCLFRNENALTVIGAAENGEVLASFDPLFPDRVEGGYPALSETSIVGVMR